MARRRDTAPYAAFAAQLRAWIGEYRYRHGMAYAISTKEQAAALDINESSWGRYLNGIKLPILAHCLTIAHAFDVPLEDVLRAAAYPTVDDLILFIQRLPDTVEGVSGDDPFRREYAYLWLEYTRRSKKWPAADWRTVPQKAAAEFVLTRAELSLHERALYYADQVFSWYKATKGHTVERQTPAQLQATPL